MNRCQPFPELAEPQPGSRPFRILSGPEHAGSVDLIQRRMRVPLTRAGRPVSRHELGHVRFSPLQLPEVDFPVSCLQAVEDARVNQGLTALGTPVELDAGSHALAQELAAEDIASGQPGLLVLRCVASIGTGGTHGLVSVARSVDPELADLARCASRTVRTKLLASAKLRGEPEAEFEVGLRAAAELASLLKAAGTEPPEVLGSCGCVVRVPGRSGGGEDALPDEVPSGHMTIRRAPATLPIPGMVRSRGRWRPAEEGSIVREPHRWSLDRRIFRRPVRSRSGTVLIDVSGSMSLEPEDVSRMVQHAGAALKIAIYSGRRSEGELRLIVHGGRRAADEHLEPYGRGNIVDLPALEWLARQEGPRIWLSDGGVTGVNDMPSKELRDACKSLVRRARIQRVDSVEEAARLLR